MAAIAFVSEALTPAAQPSEESVSAALAVEAPALPKDEAAAKSTDEVGCEVADQAATVAELAVDDQTEAEAEAAAEKKVGFAQAAPAVEAAPPEQVVAEVDAYDGMSRDEFYGIWEPEVTAAEMAAVRAVKRLEAAGTAATEAAHAALLVKAEVDVPAAEAAVAGAAAVTAKWADRVKLATDVEVEAMGVVAAARAVAEEAAAALAKVRAEEEVVARRLAKVTAELSAMRAALAVEKDKSVVDVKAMARDISNAQAKVTAADAVHKEAAVAHEEAVKLVAAAQAVFDDADKAASLAANEAEPSLDAARTARAAEQKAKEMVQAAEAAAEAKRMEVQAAQARAAAAESERLAAVVGEADAAAAAAATARAAREAEVGRLQAEADAIHRAQAMAFAEKGRLAAVNEARVRLAKHRAAKLKREAQHEAMLHARAANMGLHHLGDHLPIKAAIPQASRGMLRVTSPHSASHRGRRPPSPPPLRSPPRSAPVSSRGSPVASNIYPYATQLQTRKLGTSSSSPPAPSPTASASPLTIASSTSSPEKTPLAPNVVSTRRSPMRRTHASAQPRRSPARR